MNLKLEGLCMQLNEELKLGKGEGYFIRRSGVSRIELRYQELTGGVPTQCVAYNEGLILGYMQGLAVGEGLIVFAREMKL